MKDMEVRIEKIGPERAEGLLAHQRNRNLNPVVVRKLARDMEAGNWRPNSTIQIARIPDGEWLIDGQHRLRALIRTGTFQEFVVVYVSDLDDQLVVDTGRARTLGDTLAIRGEGNANTLASAIAWYWRRQSGYYTSSHAPTIAEGLRILRDHPALRDSIHPTRAATKTIKFPAGLACCLHYEMTLLDPESAYEFWAKLASPSSMSERHPIFVLRAKLEKNAVSAGVKLDIAMLHALAIKAWNAYMRGADVSYLRWVRGGACPELFPELQGPDDGGSSNPEATP